MAEDGQFRVVLSFAQMAAILTQESLSPAEIMSNRIFGSLRLVGGIVELAGSGVLCAVPEPTMITKNRMCRDGCACFRPAFGRSNTANHGQRD